MTYESITMAHVQIQGQSHFSIMFMILSKEMTVYVFLDKCSCRKKIKTSARLTIKISMNMYIIVH